MYGIDLFSGAGGMSVGASWAGVRNKIAIDCDKNAFDTYSVNHSKVLTICANMQEIFDLKAQIDPNNLVIYGGPPCQGFSTSNQRNRGTKNEKNWIFKAFVAFVENVKPKWVVFENVRGILETEGGFFANEIEQSIREIGYSTSSGLLNAADFGVPQNRSRFFLIAKRGGDAPSLPKAPAIPKVVVRNAFEDLPKLSVGSSVCTLPYARKPRSNYAKFLRGNLSESTNHLVSKNAEYVIERYKHVPQGGNWEDIPSEIMDNYQDHNRCHTGIYRRLDLKKPSVVIGNYRKNMLIHPLEDRGLSVREAARLQSFPDNYIFKGSIGFQQQQVGNAVPPLLAKAVFSKILNSK